MTGSLTLNGQGDPNSVFIFQIPSSLTTDVGSTITFTNGAQPCNVFWQVGSSATLNGSTFVGNVLALAPEGRAWVHRLTHSQIDDAHPS